MALPESVRSAGWILMSQKIEGTKERMSLRNTRLTLDNFETELNLLTRALLQDRWFLIHHGQIGTVWSALLEREVP